MSEWGKLFIIGSLFRERYFTVSNIHQNRFPIRSINDRKSEYTMSNEAEYWTAPTDSAEHPGALIMVTGRRNVEKFRSNPRFKYRVTVIWPYDGGKSGMPDRPTAELMEQVNDAMERTFRKDPVAVITGIYTGDNRRDWVIYTTSLHIFQRKLNEILQPFEQLPLQFEAAEDPDWEEYQQMKEATEISDEEE